MTCSLAAAATVPGGPLSAMSVIYHPDVHLILLADALGNALAQRADYSKSQKHGPRLGQSWPAVPRRLVEKAVRLGSKPGCAARVDHVHQRLEDVGGAAISLDAPPKIARCWHGSETAAPSENTLDLIAASAY